MRVDGDRVVDAHGGEKDRDRLPDCWVCERFRVLVIGARGVEVT